MAKSELTIDQMRAAVDAHDAAQRKPLTELIDSPEFVAVADKMAAIGDTLDGDAVYGPFAKALRTVIAGIRKRRAAQPVA